MVVSENVLGGLLVVLLIGIAGSAWRMSHESEFHYVFLPPPPDESGAFGTGSFNTLRHPYGRRSSVAQRECLALQQARETMVMTCALLRQHNESSERLEVVEQSLQLASAHFRLPPREVYNHVTQIRAHLRQAGVHEATESLIWAPVVAAGRREVITPGDYAVLLASYAAFRIAHYSPLKAAIKAGQINGFIP